MRRAAGIGLFVFFQSLYALTSSGNAFRIPDEFEVYFQTEHLIDAGDLSVPQALEIRQPVIVDGKIVGQQSMFFGKIGVDGKPYAPYGPLAAVLAVPHHLAGRALASMMGIPRVPRAQGLAWVIFVGGVTMLATATAAALAIVGFHRAALALGTPPRMALALSLILGGATVLWPYGTSLFSEAFVASALIWAAALLIESRNASAPATKVMLAALLIVVAGLTKVTSVIVAPAFVVAVMAERSLDMPRRLRAAAAMALAILVAGAMQLGWNEYRFGSPFDLGYDWSETIPALPARAFAVEDIPRGLAVLLLAPGKSLFVWAPILVVALLNAPAVWRRDRALATGLIASAAFGLIVYAAYLFPEGGYGHGPRHLVPIVPLLVLAAAGPLGRAHKPALLWTCAAIGFAIALTATRVSYLEDQALRRDASGRAVANYYEEITPAPGRPSNRYRLEHLPFVNAMGSPGWSESAILGQGPDHFYKHLQQARRQLPDGQSIPEMLPVAWQAAWIVFTLGGGVLLVSQYRRLPVDRETTAGDEGVPAPPPVADDFTAIDGSPDWAHVGAGALQASPLLQTVQRFLPLIVVLLTAVILAAELNQGWMPFDEGALGQAAERVLDGEVPHRDFDDIYTGLLAYLHAAFFSVGSHTSSTLRIPLFLFALPWSVAMFAIARRFVPPIGAALVAVTAVVWSVPNYPAAMPSWFNLFFATFGALALLRGLETSQRRWFVFAGMAGGISFLFKLSGIFFLLGGGIALIATSFRSNTGGERANRSGAALVAALLLPVFAVLAIPITRAGTGEMFRFLVPLGVLFAALIWREWQHGGTTLLERGRELFKTMTPFIFGALLPLMVYGVFLLWTGALSQTIDGVLIKPFRRMESAMMHPPPPSALINSLAFVLLLAWPIRRRAATMVAIVAAALFALVIYASGTNPRIYALGVMAGWGLPFLAAAGAAWLVLKTGASARRMNDAAVVITAIACATLLIEFPYAAPTYLMYSIPLAMLAMTAVVGAAGRTHGAIQLVVVLFMLVFGLVRVNPGTAESFGRHFMETDETVRLRLPKSGLRVRGYDAERYETLIAAVQDLSQGRTLWAGPDAPEIYFLSGVPNRTRTLFDFLDGPNGAAPVIERVRAAGATLVVLNMQPDFSGMPDQATVAALLNEFPNVRKAPGFLVFWR